MNDVVPLLKHNPSAQDPAVLEAITVQRESLIASLVESAMDLDGGLRHRLLVGPRGMGKTHILSLVANRLSDTQDGDRLVVAWLDEDPWAIRTYEKFLAAIVERVAEATDDSELAESGRALRSDPRMDGLEGEELLRGAVGDRRLVLLVENLDEIFRRIRPEGQARLRAFAEGWRQLLIFATSPQIFAGIHRHDSPFYGFFAVTHLDELSLDSAAELLRRVAELHEDRELLDFLRTDRARRRLKAIESLAGGHPRIWLLLAGCVSIAAIDDLVPLFLEALDELTPYYQDKLRELSDQQQELIVLLAEAGGALSNRDLSERSGIAQNQVATILRQLTDRAYVRRAEVDEEVADGDRRMSFWELREPLMRLCLDVKQARGKPLRLVVEFLRAWYGPRILDELARLPEQAELAAEYAGEAFRALDEPLSRDDLLRGTPEEIVARAERGLAVTPERTDLKLARAAGLLAAERLDEARDVLRPVLDGGKIDSPDQVRLLWRCGVLAGRAADHEQALGLFSLLVEFEPEVAAVHYNLSLSLGHLGRFKEAVEAGRRAAELAPDDPDVQDSLAVMLSEAGRFEEALAALEIAWELDPDDARIASNRGTVLASMDRYEEALAAYRTAAALDSENPVVQANLALSLHRLGRFGEALIVLEKGIQVAPDDAELHVFRGVVLTELKMGEEAQAAFGKAVEIQPDAARHHWLQADALLRLGRLKEAEHAVDCAIGLDGQDPAAFFIAAEIALARHGTDEALGRLRTGLDIAQSGGVDSSGEPGALCKILWERFDAGRERTAAISALVRVCRGADALDDLGRGIVGSVPFFVDPAATQAEADAWVADWIDADEGDQLDIPLSLLKAARDWKHDRDRAHLLRLPREQREILVSLLGEEAENT